MVVYEIGALTMREFLPSCWQVYIIVAILKHLEPTMRELTASHNSQSLSPFLKLIREPIRNFRFSQWRPLLLCLRSDYHQEVRAVLFPPKSG